MSKVVYSETIKGKKYEVILYEFDDGKFTVDISVIHRLVAHTSEDFKYD